MCRWLKRAVWQEAIIICAVPCRSTVSASPCADMHAAVQMEIARLESRSEAASAAAQELEARAQTAAAASAGAIASAQQAQRDAQAQVTCCCYSSHSNNSLCWIFSCIICFVLAWDLEASYCRRHRQRTASAALWAGTCQVQLQLLSRSCLLLPGADFEGRNWEQDTQYALPLSMI